MSEIPETVWAVGKVLPLDQRTNAVYYDTPIRASEREGLAPLTVEDADGERVLPVFTSRFKAERGILHFMTPEERADGPIASVRIGLEDLLKTFRGPQPEGTPKVDYIGVNMGEGGTYPLIRL
jgi:SseB protein N-terminal domain